MYNLIEISYTSFEIYILSLAFVWFSNMRFRLAEVRGLFKTMFYVFHAMQIIMLIKRIWIYLECFDLRVQSVFY